MCMPWKTTLRAKSLRNAIMSVTVASSGKPRNLTQSLIEVLDAGETSCCGTMTGAKGDCKVMIELWPEVICGISRPCEDRSCKRAADDGSYVCKGYDAVASGDGVVLGSMLRFSTCKIRRENKFEM